MSDGQNEEKREAENSLSSALRGVAIDRARPVQWCSSVAEQRHTRSLLFLCFDLLRDPECQQHQTTEVNAEKASREREGKPMELQPSGGTGSLERKVAFKLRSAVARSELQRRHIERLPRKSRR